MCTSYDKRFIKHKHQNIRSVFWRLYHQHTWQTSGKRFCVLCTTKGFFMNEFIQKKYFKKRWKYYVNYFVYSVQSKLSFRTKVYFLKGENKIDEISPFNFLILCESFLSHLVTGELSYLGLKKWITTQIRLFVHTIAFFVLCLNKRAYYQLISLIMLTFNCLNNSGDIFFLLSIWSKCFLFWLKCVSLYKIKRVIFALFKLWFLMYN